MVLTASNGRDVDLDAASMLDAGRVMTKPDLSGPPPADSVISIRGLKKSFGDLDVLDRVDLEVSRGSIAALLGSNGAGKTTLVKILATLLSPDAGEVMINGFDVVHLLRRFSLTDAADRKAATYSGGMRRRLDIAMSLIGDPPVVFLDEPTTGLERVP